eukprot:CCRYP_001175-RA/>CCRYP_001175-RA protein AED:0.03 eAED:0.03 QI:87/1/1/1/1/1/4/83/651
MIAAVTWIPRGVAASTPTKYEYSKAEQEFLERVAHADGNGQLDGAAEEEHDGADDEEGEWEDVDQDNGEEDGEIVLPKVDLASLPADLRMDEYSDDDGEDGKDVGKMLVGKDAEMNVDGDDEEHQDDAVTDTDRQDKGDRDHDSDSDVDDDDLSDIPDTREYMPLDVQGLQSLGIGGSNGGNDAYTFEDLKNMTDNDVYDEDLEEDEEDEDYLDDVRIRYGDALVVVAKTEEDFASLEINIFDTEASNLYVHHDIPLPSFPLCLALGNVISGPSNSTTTGNFCAVGSFETGIEIWNLDVMNALEPSLVLGGMDTRGLEENWMRMQANSLADNSHTGSQKKKKKKKGKLTSASNGLREGSHTDAVMGLSWNTIHRQVLASGSADGTVKLWDVTHTTSGGDAGDYVRPSATLTHHSDKVQSLAWHPSEGTLLATGGYDRKVCLVDARSAVTSANAGSVKKVKLLADCEAMAWDPHSQHYLTVASEDGVVQCWDVRKFDDPVWSMVAHEYGGVSDICYNPQVPGMLLTCSIDKTVALWDTQHAPTPQSCGTKDMNVGKLYSVSCYPSSPWLMACGGSGNELAIWDMEEEDAIQNRFAPRVSLDGAVPSSKNDGIEPDFEAIMASGDNDATAKALEGMNKSKKKKGKKKKVHKRS